MLPLGHMGITAAVVRVLENHFQSPWVDYRLLLVASLLPDLIDKPITYLLSAHSVISGRNYAHYGHSIFFLLLLFIAGVVQWYYRNYVTVLTLCLGSLFHDTLDVISHHEDWAERALYSTTVLMVFEIIGGCILIYFFINLLVDNKIAHFIRTGKL